LVLRAVLGLVVLALVAAGCTDDDADSGAAGERSRSVVSLTFIHMNDVYEMTPVGGGKEGGLARLAVLRRQLVAANPNTYTVLAGDLVSPPALGTATVEGERLAGKQMIDVMNVLGLDYATFGNHEFDLGQEQLSRRLAQSRSSGSRATWPTPAASRFPTCRRTSRSRPDGPILRSRPEGALDR
jgi:5'-nucleotidase/UDP-sugar diphosphatase